MADQVLNCRTCGKEFTFSQREQEFYAAKQFAEPRHCQECRAQRKREKSEGTEGMEVVVVRPIRQDRARNWTEVPCANCGKPAHVPFKPTGDKPIYCKDCFNIARNSPDGVIQSTPISKPTAPANPPKITQTQNEVRPPITTNTPESGTADPHAWLDDPGPLPDTDPAPDEEGEITIADYIPMPMSFGGTAEEVNPTFDEPHSTKPKG